ncbi:MAG: beta-glucosidase [Rhizobiaceae bacterium]|nr:beta-glucosidase [Rhizobiaceae bacterium]
MKIGFTRSDFPAGFLFGAATAAYQIEGTSFGNCGPSHWDSFAATPGNVVGGDDGAVACEHYLRFAEDLDLLSTNDFDAYRFSVSWPRIMPEGRGAVNVQGLDFYDRLVDAMLERGLKPYLTLYHWDLPSALADVGGWRNRDVASWFADFARVVMQRVGDRIAATATLNEPWCIAWLSHFLGIHAPGLRDIRAAARAMHHVLLAHGTALEAMRADGHRNLGIVLNLQYAEPGAVGDAHAKAALLEDGIFNRWFLDGLFHGTYPDDVLAGLEPHLPTGWEKDMATISRPMDWLGINYYTRRRVLNDPNALWPHQADAPPVLPVTDMGWEVYPDGLYSFLIRVHRDFSKGLPIFVTENGMANADVMENGSVWDPQRIEFLNLHFDAVRRAIRDGVPVGGYFVWSLLDNYEWALGYSKRFGMVYVDYETQKRTPKASFNALAAAIRRSR